MGRGLTMAGLAAALALALPEVAWATVDALDQFAGTRVSVTIATYSGEDPWQAEDLLACGDATPVRFADATPEQREQALKRTGPCSFADREPAGYGYRDTADGHVHADFDKPYGQFPDGTYDVVAREATRLEIGLDPDNDRYHQTDIWTGIGPDGVLASWRDAVYYLRGERLVAVGGCMTRPGPLAGGPCLGLAARFELLERSPNGFQVEGAVLDCAADAASCALDVLVSSRVNGARVFAHIVLTTGAPPVFQERIPEALR